MTTTIRFEFCQDQKPPTKGRHRTRRLPNGHFLQYPDPDTVRAERNIALAFMLAAPAWQAHTGPVSLDVLSYWPIPASWPQWRRQQAASGLLLHTGAGDADNVLKLIADALEGTAYVNDHQVWHQTCEKRYSQSPHVEVCLTFHDAPKRATAAPGAMEGVSTQKAPRGHAKPPTGKGTRQVAVS